MDFQVGEKVIYPNHGIGVVERIQSRRMDGGTITGYELRILANDSRVWIPQTSTDGVGLRPVITSDAARELLMRLGDEEVDQQANWKGRFKENSDRMRSGCIQDVAMVLKGLSYLSQRKALSFREKRMLDRARFLVVSEIAEVEGVSAQSVEEQVDRALSRAFAGTEGAADRQKPVGNPRPSNA